MSVLDAVMHQNQDWIHTKNDSFPCSYPEKRKLTGGGGGEKEKARLWYKKRGQCLFGHLHSKTLVELFDRAVTPQRGGRSGEVVLILPRGPSLLGHPLFQARLRANNLRPRLSRLFDMDMDIWPGVKMHKIWYRLGNLNSHYTLNCFAQFWEPSLLHLDLSCCGYKHFNTKCEQSLSTQSRLIKVKYRLSLFSQSPSV